MPIRKNAARAYMYQSVMIMSACMHKKRKVNLPYAHLSVSCSLDKQKDHGVSRCLNVSKIPNCMAAPKSPYLGTGLGLKSPNTVISD
ncbi:MAG: hypothetical protein H6Q52_2608 [Deltaproteobacteria bacterium]|nr:hypothetical protein [Deltaproteobacteria bacterium]